MLKRTFDFTISLIGIIISIPVWILIVLAIILEDGLPIFYIQERIGKGGRVFRAFKFRSMIKNAEEGIGPIQAAEADQRVTKVGRILRATAMDELPQLINILKGDMSFVGPRALRPVEIENGDLRSETGSMLLENKDYRIRNMENREVENNGKNAIPLDEIPGYHKRHVIKPGLTGLAQVYLSTDAPRPKKFRYDLLYINRQTFLLDFKLIFLSFWVTFRGKWGSREKKL